MQRRLMAVAVAGLLAAPAFAAEINTDFAYHSGATDERGTEKVPGQTVTFLTPGASVKDADPVAIYIMTANQFAGEAEEQVFVRWWNGTEEKWIMGTWLANAKLGTGAEAIGPFHGQPATDPVMVDIWKVDITPDVTLPGDNYYVIQLKAWAEGTIAEYYLTRDLATPENKLNNVGQAWTPEANWNEHDWKVVVTP